MFLESAQFTVPAKCRSFIDEIIQNFPDVTFSANDDITFSIETGSGPQGSKIQRVFIIKPNKKIFNAEANYSLYTKVYYLNEADIPSLRLLKEDFGLQIFCD